MPKPPWDQNLANAAQVVQQCTTLGGVVLTPKPQVGIQPPKRPS